MIKLNKNIARKVFPGRLRVVRLRNADGTFASLGTKAHYSSARFRKNKPNKAKELTAIRSQKLNSVSFAERQRQLYNKQYRRSQPQQQQQRPQPVYVQQHVASVPTTTPRQTVPLSVTSPNEFQQALRVAKQQDAASAASKRARAAQKVTPEARKQVAHTMQDDVRKQYQEAFKQNKARRVSRQAKVVQGVQHGLLGVSSGISAVAGVAYLYSLTKPRER